MNEKEKRPRFDIGDLIYQLAWPGAVGHVAGSRILNGKKYYLVSGQRGLFEAFASDLGLLRRGPIPELEDVAQYPLPSRHGNHE